MPALALNQSIKNAQEKLSQQVSIPQGFVINAQGCYSYKLNGSLSNIWEPWRILSNNENELLIQSARYVDDHNIAILVEHLTQNSEKLGVLTNSFSCSISWQSQNKIVKSCRYNYLQGDTTLNGLETTNEVDISHELSLPKSQHFQFFPLMRIFTGKILKNLSSHGQHNIILPDIRTVSEPSTLLVPYLSLRSAKYISDEKIIIAEQKIPCQKFSYLSELYQSENSAIFWLNNDGLLAKYQWQQTIDQLWQVELHKTAT